MLVATHAVTYLFCWKQNKTVEAGIQSNPLKTSQKAICQPLVSMD